MTTSEAIIDEIKALTEQRRVLDAALSGKRAELRVAQLAETGLDGHVVEFGGGRKTRILVRAMGQWGSRYVSGPVIKKDGTVGIKIMDAPLSALTDLGPHVPA